MSLKAEEFLLRHSLNIIEQYNWELPFHLFLKNYFNKNKGLGARDRRRLRSLTYGYYRLNNVLSKYNTREKLLLADYISSQQPLKISLAEAVDINGWPQHDFGHSPVVRFLALQSKEVSISLENILPKDFPLSQLVNKKSFQLSVLQQPYTWIRIRHPFIELTKTELAQKNINPIASFELNAMGFEPGIALHDLDAYRKGWFEIQDISSQQTLNVLPEITPEQTWWDCCAGSGGKSLLFKEKFPNTNLIISDTRDSILANAKQRILKARAKHVSFVQCNLEKPQPDFLLKPVDGIIADVPCSGSGTWARTPESFTSFKAEAGDSFVKRQQSIIENCLPLLNKNGWLLYITCSVFEAENEANIEIFLKRHPLRLMQMRYIEGTTYRGDTMFYSLMQKV